MSERLGGGIARYGLLGLILGVAISWMAGAHGPLAEAQTRAVGEGGSQVSMSGRGTEVGRVLQGPGRLLASGEANGTLAMVTAPGGSAQWLYAD